MIVIDDNVKVTALGRALILVLCPTIVKLVGHKRVLKRSPIRLPDIGDETKRERH